MYLKYDLLSILSGVTRVFYIEFPLNTLRKMILYYIYTFYFVIIFSTS